MKINLENLFGIVREKKETEFESFLSVMQVKGFKISVFDKRKIERNCNRDTLHSLRSLLPALATREISLVFMRGKRGSWPSDATGNLVINLAADFKNGLKRNDELVQMIRKDLGEI